MSIDFTKRILAQLECPVGKGLEGDPMIETLEIVEYFQMKNISIPYTLHILVARLAIKARMYDLALKAIYQASMADPFAIELEAISIDFNHSLKSHFLNQRMPQSDLKRLDKIISTVECFDLADSLFYERAANCFAMNGMPRDANRMLIKKMVAKNAC